MHRSICTLFVLLIVQVSQAQSVLDIHFQSIKTGEAILINTSNYQYKNLSITNGNISYEGNIEDPTLYSLIITGYNESRPMDFILSNERTEIKFDHFKKVTESNDVKEIYPNQPHFIKDPNKNQVFYEFHSDWLVFYDKIQELTTPESEEFLEKRKEVYNTFIKECETLIKNNKQEYASAVVINYLIKGRLLPLETIQTFYDYLDPKVKSSYFGIAVGEYAGKAGKLSAGNPAPEFELYDMDGNKYNLANLRGKKILLHFWSSWCAPCIKEAPELIQLSTENKEHLIVINISLDTKKENWIKGIARASIGNLNNVCDFQGFEGKLAKDYSIKLVPTSYLIDEEGKIILKGSLNQIQQILP